MLFIKNKYFSSTCSLFTTTEEKAILVNFSGAFSRRKNEKSAPVGI